MEIKLKLFNQKAVRTVWNADEEEWYFSVVDVCNVLSDSAGKDPGAYWRKLKQRQLKVFAHFSFIFGVFLELAPNFPPNQQK